MSERSDYGDHYDIGPPEPLEWQDVPAGGEHLDHDDLDVDPLDDGVEPPALDDTDRYETAADEPSLADRLAAEEPDIVPEPPDEP
ncbi:hypothetical protein [Nocardia transvalensis]|uniref:hypothetical protein n=1 Tax=Nocardia transvalensis TaxID=37333 RepID=UPI0018939566|nr:hypothetical protein [Nocardia transvalensis]MBF6327825.1 hypothetical protein [Nocardia transvalensis]